MPDLVEYTFSFQDLLSPDQAINQRWVELMEVIDQLFVEFVHPILERTKNLKSIYTADEDDLDAINIDKYHYLFEGIQETASTKRAALWIQTEIIKAKNRNDSLDLAVASLGYPRESLRLLPYYAQKAGEYSQANLRKIDAIIDIDEYYMTSKIGVSLDRNALHAEGQDPVVAEETVIDQLGKNVMPEHMELIFSYFSETSGLKKSLGYTNLSKKINITTV